MKNNILVKDLKKGQIIWECASGQNTRLEVLRDPMYLERDQAYVCKVQDESGKSLDLFQTKDIKYHHYGPQLYDMPMYMNSKELKEISNKLADLEEGCSCTAGSLDSKEFFDKVEESKNKWTELDELEGQSGGALAGDLKEGIIEIPKTNHKEVEEFLDSMGVKRKNSKPKVIVKERGWAGHLRISNNCLFRRNTLISCKKEHVVVSTVGNYVCPLDKKITDIGPRGSGEGAFRYFETMAFIGKRDGPYMDADVCKEIDFESKWSICANTVEELPKDVDNLANDMHDMVVEEIVGKMKSGWLPSHDFQDNE